MAKAAEFAPRIKAALEDTRSGEPVTVRQLADVAGCSVQQVYKVLSQLGTKASVVGNSPTGAYLYRYDPDGAEVPRAIDRRAMSVTKGVAAGGQGRGGKRRPRKAILQINDLLTIKGIREAEAGGLEVEFENQAGERVKAVVLEGNNG